VPTEQAGSYQLLPVERLRLDTDNPRLPETVVGQPQHAVLTYLHEQAVLEELAASFVDNGYFAHEPLIVTPDGDGWRVIEGNRRLATLMILLQLPLAVDADVRFLLDPEPSAERLIELRRVPCSVVESGSAVHSFLGFRHIGGIKTWSAEAKARYIIREVEQLQAQEPGNVFARVARRVGSNVQGIRNSYLAMRVLLHARDALGLPIQEVQLRRFGVWTRAMNSADLREYIGLGAPKTYEEIQGALEELHGDRLREVFSDLSSGEGRRRPVLGDSREVTVYAQILQHAEARATLRRYDNLELARQVVEHAELPARLRRIVDSVEVVSREVQREGAPPEALPAAEELSRLSRSLAVTIRDQIRGSDADAV